MSRPAAVFACTLILAVSGCDSVSSDSIQRWKTTEKGPGKLRDAFRNSRVDPRLRAEAAMALVDIGSSEDVDSSMATIDANTRWEILKTLIPLYTETMRGTDVVKARDARDALFSVRTYAPPEEQKQIDAALLASIEKDLRAGRAAGGRHSIEKILLAIGAPAGPLLVTLLEDPNTPLPAIVDVLAKVAEPGVREKASAILVKKATAEKRITPPLWQALGQMGGAAATKLLIDRFNRGGNEALLAMSALQQNRDPSLLPFALEKAGDPRVAKELRGEVFGLVEIIGGVAASEGLIKIIGSDHDEIVRYRAFEGALAVGKEAAIGPALEAFPAKESYKRDDVVDFLVKDIEKVGKRARPAVVALLASPSPLARMTGVLALESVGSSDDVAAVKKLAADKATVKGFAAGQTVGKEAVRVAAALQKKTGT